MTDDELHQANELAEHIRVLRSHIEWLREEGFGAEATRFPVTSRCQASVRHIVIEDLEEQLAAKRKEFEAL